MGRHVRHPSAFLEPSANDRLAFALMEGPSTILVSVTPAHPEAALRPPLATSRRQTRPHQLLVELHHANTIAPSFRLGKRKH